MKYRVFCLYASMKDSEPAPWMIAAEDEYSWEADPGRCDAVFRKAHADALENGWEVREVTLLIDIDVIQKAFLPAEVEAEVE